MDPSSPAPCLLRLLPLWMGWRTVRCWWRSVRCLVVLVVLVVWSQVPSLTAWMLAWLLVAWLLMALLLKVQVVLWVQVVFFLALMVLRRGGAVCVAATPMQVGTAIGIIATAP